MSVFNVVPVKMRQHKEELFGIRYMQTNLKFTYAYPKQEMAELIAERLESPGRNVTIQQTVNFNFNDRNPVSRVTQAAADQLSRDLKRNAPLKS